MRFRYVFQQIVDLKENEKTQAEWLLSHAAKELREEEGVLESLLSEKQLVHGRMIDAAETRTTISEVRMYQHYMSHIDARIVRKHEDIRQAESNVADRRQQLSHKAAEEKVWTNARERAKQQHVQVALRKEQETLDEMATMRFERAN